MNLIELFDEEGIIICNLQTGIKNANITIRLNNKRQFDCWTYFCRKLVEKEVATYHKIYPEISINIVDGKYEEFINMLSKKYYKFNPKRKNISVLVKPTVQCNLDCQYCYDKPFRESVKTFMSVETVEDIVKKVAEYAEECCWIWHGGEPTLMGVEWFTEVYEKVFSKYPMVDFDFSIMSNGVNYNDDFLRILQKYKIEPGSSYNMGFQDELRCSGSGIKYADKIWGNFLSYKEKGQFLGVIEVITKINVHSQIDIYEKYKKDGVGLAFNHIFHTNQTMKNQIEVDFKIYSEHFKKYLEYYIYDTSGVYERSAMEAIRLVIGNRKLCCTNSDCRYNWFGVMPNGDLYPCDRYFEHKYRMGNVHEYKELDEMFKSDNYKNYVSECQKRYDTHCKECGYFEFCQGGCNASAIESSGSAEGVEQFYCDLFKEKFRITYELLRNLDVIWDKLNPHVRQELLVNEFYSVNEIKGYLKENNKSLNLNYDNINLLDCLEYKVFRGLNPIKTALNSNKHVNVIHTRDKVVLRKNRVERRKNLKKAIKGHFLRLEVKYGPRK